jgi:ABC-type multidrug transport system fused ATPase/permease subunit
VAGGSVGLLHNTILTNFGTMMRWRAHRHVLRQPVGWFESDFAGRIANRIMQAPLQPVRRCSRFSTWPPSPPPPSSAR